MVSRCDAGMQTTQAYAWFNLGIAYNRAGKPAEAARAYDRAYEIEPGDAEYKQLHEMRGTAASTRPTSLWRLISGQ